MVVANRHSLKNRSGVPRSLNLAADGYGTAEIRQATGKAKPVIRRWQERFRDERAAAFWRDETRPSRIAPLGPEGPTRWSPALTLAEAPPAASHWADSATAKAVGISVSSVQRIWCAHGFQPHRVRQFSCPPIRSSRPSCTKSSASMSTCPITPLSCRSARRERSRSSTAPSQTCP